MTTCHLLPIGFRITVPKKGDGLVGVCFLPMQPVVIVRVVLREDTASYVSVLAGVHSRGALPLVLGSGPVLGELFTLGHVCAERDIELHATVGQRVELWFTGDDDAWGPEVCGTLEVQVPDLGSGNPVDVHLFTKAVRGDFLVGLDWTTRTTSWRWGGASVYLSKEPAHEP